MKINFAHLRVQGQNVAIFDANAQDKSNSGRDVVLQDLVARVVASNYRVDKAALAFKEHGRLKFYGTSDLVRYLSNNPMELRWTHTIEV